MAAKSSRRRGGSSKRECQPRCRPRHLTLTRNCEFIFCELATLNMDILLRYIREIDIGESSIGDMCCSLCFGRWNKHHNGSCYISPTNTVNNIKFLYKRLMIYGQLGYEELGENYHSLPPILAGDFNVNIASEVGHNSW
ncbi:ATP-dependent DNA helicase [Trichonephila clavipes]|nr:ATP-dependent DNA helicase [Trichonephila clavipes]